MLSPADIEKKQFTQTRLRSGYSPEEVDEFLDRVASDYAETQKHVDRLTSDLRNNTQTVKMSSIPPAPPKDQPSMESVNRLLEVAQQTVDKQQAEAHAEAGRTVAEASEEARKILADAQAEAAVIRREADADRTARFEALDAQCAELTTKVDVLKAKESEYRAWLKRSLDAFGRELGETNG